MLKDYKKQSGHPERTSLNQVPKLFNMVNWEGNTKNLDYGGGEYDKGSEYLKEFGVKNYVFDTFARVEDYNRKVAQEIKNIVGNGGFDTTTCCNVLNVIEHDIVIRQIIQKCARSVKQDGKSYFQVYAKKGDLGMTKRETYQNGKRIKEYDNIFKEYYKNVRYLGNDCCVCTEPIKENTKEQDWYFDKEQTTEKSLSFSIDYNEFSILMF